MAAEDDALGGGAVEFEADAGGLGRRRRRRGRGRGRWWRDRCRRRGAAATSTASAAGCRKTCAKDEGEHTCNLAERFSGAETWPHTLFLRLAGSAGVRKGQGQSERPSRCDWHRPHAFDQRNPGGPALTPFALTDPRHTAGGAVRPQTVLWHDNQQRRPEITHPKL